MRVVFVRQVVQKDNLESGVMTNQKYMEAVLFERVSRKTHPLCMLLARLFESGNL